MTDIVPTNSYDDEDLLPDIYVEIKSRMLYDCKFFDTSVLVRPATPQFYLSIRKINHKEFVSEFEEFCGDKEEARKFLRGAPAEIIIQ